MKKTFFEYYALSNSEMVAIWNHCHLVLDTNVLLNLYRYSPSTRDDILSTLNNFVEKIWMPFQVGWEFHNNRDEVLKKTYFLPEALKAYIATIKKKFINDFRCNYIRNPFLTIESLEKKLDKLEDSLFKFINDKFKDAFDANIDDPILSELNKLYEGRVGVDFDVSTLNSIYSEGAKRYAAKIPPGYKDETEKKNRGERHLYGDLIIWKQIIQQSRSSGQDILFVSDDLKDDWLRVDNGEKKGPRRELLREFFLETGGRKIVIMTQDSFLSFIHSLPEHSIKSSTRKEVEASNHKVYKYTLNLDKLDETKSVLDLFYKSLLANDPDAGSHPLVEEKECSSLDPSFTNDTPGGESSSKEDEDKKDPNKDDGEGGEDEGN